MKRPLSVDEVARLLAENIRRGDHPIGSRLPPVRKIAAELGSNPSTVDRALHRLAEAGMVRTVPRRGIYVTAVDIPADLTSPVDGDLLEQALLALRTAGMSLTEARSLVAERLDELFVDPRILFVECNPVDAENLADMVTNATGVSLIPVTLDQLSEIDDYEAVAVPLFHLGDLHGRVAPDKPVVDLQFHRSSRDLRLLATLDPTARIAIAAATESGAERLLGTVRHYFRGDVEVVGTNGTENPAPYDAVVRTPAAGGNGHNQLRAAREIVLGWELDTASSSTFLTRSGIIAS